jgi:hypothetical protein
MSKQKTAKVKIILDPTQWPTDTYGGRGTLNHIKYDQTYKGKPWPPPEALWPALDAWAINVPKVPDNFVYWWKDLSPFDPTLRGWKLTGHGDMPLTVLNPKEKPRPGDLKLAFGEVDDLAEKILDEYRPFGN